MPLARPGEPHRCHHRRAATGRVSPVFLLHTPDGGASMTAVMDTETRDFEMISLLVAGIDEAFPVLVGAFEDGSVLWAAADRGQSRRRRGPHPGDIHQGIPRPPGFPTRTDPRPPSSRMAVDDRPQPHPQPGADDEPQATAIGADASPRAGDLRPGTGRARPSPPRRRGSGSGGCRRSGRHSATRWCCAMSSGSATTSWRLPPGGRRGRSRQMCTVGWRSCEPCIDEEER